MAAKKLNISIPEEQAVFLDENPSLSPSKLLQIKVEEIQNSIKHNPQLIEALKTIELLKRKCDLLQRELEKVQYEKENT